MLQGIDHVALVVHDLEAAIAAHEARGFAVVRGGQHPNGSHNAFISFPNGSVLELFGFLDPARANEHRYWNDLQRGEGLVDWCMATDDLDGDAARFRAAGFAVGDAIARTRTRPDGMELRWRVAITQAPHRRVVPFLIADETPRRERIPQAAVQPNGCLGITEIVVAVTDVDGPRRWCESVLGEAPAAATTEQGTGVTATIGALRIVWLAPSAGSPLAHHVATRGPGPVSATPVTST
jgi:hypothetical protein